MVLLFTSTGKTNLTLTVDLKKSTTIHFSGSVSLVAK
jgi:hypothetical protein